MATEAISSCSCADGDAAARAAFWVAAGEREALEYTRRLAHRHYENFSVVSMLLPRRLRQDFCNVYAFCRIADDLGDEVPDRGRAMEYLERLKQQTRECYAGRVETALFVALRGTIRKHDLPMGPFLDLIDAFEQDQRVRRYETFAQLLDYCRRSANPVGRLVLGMCGYRDERRAELSDKTCSALQLANFWQDVRRDILERDRIYIPRESMERFGVSEEQIQEGRCDENYRRMMEFEVERTKKMFAEGEELPGMLAGAARGQVSLYGMGGRAVLEAIRRQGYDTLTKRPAVSGWAKVGLVGRVVKEGLGSRVWGLGAGGSEVGRSYGYCARVTREQARNFYYALKLVPEPKRSAMYALYAWMRLVDDIADEADGRTDGQREEELEAWREKTREVLQGRKVAGEIWAAVGDMVERYRVPGWVFEEAIEGQRQDLRPVVFERFGELEEYCRQVAGTVGVASIYIWGFEGGLETERMAMNRGVAFQLTNILRDLKEDLGRGRVYLPREEMAAAGVSEEDLRAGRAGVGFEGMMRRQVERAQGYYQRSEGLESRIAGDCRAGLVAMTRIYHGLLEKIAAEPGVVLRKRVSLCWVRKLMIGWRAVRGER